MLHMRPHSALLHTQNKAGGLRSYALGFCAYNATNVLAYLVHSLTRSVTDNIFKEYRAAEQVNSSFINSFFFIAFIELDLLAVSC